MIFIPFYTSDSQEVNLKPKLNYHEFLLFDINIFLISSYQILSHFAIGFGKSNGYFSPFALTFSGFCKKYPIPLGLDKKKTFDYNKK